MKTQASMLLIILIAALVYNLLIFSKKIPESKKIYVNLIYVVACISYLVIASIATKGVDLGAVVLFGVVLLASFVPAFVKKRS